LWADGTYRQRVSARASEKFKRDREDEYDPIFLPEVKPGVENRIAQLAVERVVTEPLLAVEIAGEFCSW
jgi:hypothetical protein